MSYRPTDSSQPSITHINPKTSFVTDDNLERGTEFNFSVRAFTEEGGAGVIAYVIVSTLIRPRENVF